MQKNSRQYEVFVQETVRINSFNHQAISVLGEGLKPTMHAADGLIEGVELEGEHWVCSVQWHPETMI